MIDIMISTKDRPTELFGLLQSLRTQTYQNFNIFIMDDRSGMQIHQHHFLLTIINQLKLDGHIVTIWRNDIPLGVTRLRQNIVDKIMKVGKGDSILRLDDDNLLEPTYIEKLVETIDAGYDIASGVVPSCGTPFIKRENKFVKPFISDVQMNDKGEIIYFGDDCGMRYMEEEIIPSVNFRSMALIKKSVHKDVSYEDNLGFCSFREEQWFSFRAIIKGYKIGVHTGAVAYHLNTPSGGERTQEYVNGCQTNHNLLNDFCKKQFAIYGDFLEKYREQFK